MNNDELLKRIDEKLPSKVFWQCCGIGVIILVALIGTLFTRQSKLIEAVASNSTTMAALQKAVDSNAYMATQVAVTAEQVSTIKDDVKDIAIGLREYQKINPDIMARIAREQIAWANERAERRVGK